MRFLVALESPQGAQIPLDYRRRLISLMKRVFGIREFIESSTRPYTFAVYLGKNVKVGEHFIEGVKFINLRVSTGDPVYGLRLYNGLLSLKGELHKVGEAEFNIKDIQLQEEGDWSKGYFKSLSPVVVERPKGKEDNPKLRYALPMEEDFEASTLENTLRRFVAIKGYTPEVRHFSFEFESYKEQMLKHYGGYVRCFLGKFRIRTDNPELLKFVYQYGLGLRTGQGFGYLEVV